MAAPTVRHHPAPRRLASTAETALYAGLSVRTLRRWVAEGRLTAYRFGPRALRYDLDEIDAQVHRVPSATAADRAAAGRRPLSGGAA